jgi:predicted nucleic acid-binding protein
VKAAVCDTSLLFKLIVAEPDSDRAITLIRSARIFVPDFVFLEIGNVLWSRIRRRDMEYHEAKRLLDHLRDLGFEIMQIGRFVDRALQIATAIDHPIYDCLYLALAENINVPLVTADRRFTSAIRRGRLQTAEVKLLSEAA